MGSIYRYVFYRIYRWALRVNGERDLPRLTALFVLTLTVFINLMTLEAISQMPQEDAEATETEEAEEVVWMSFPPADESSEVVEPGEEPFDLPTTLVATQGPTVLSPHLPIASIRRDHHDSPSFQQVLVERVGVVGLVADHQLGLHVEKAAVECCVDEGDFSW